MSRQGARSRGSDMGIESDLAGMDAEEMRQMLMELSRNDEGVRSRLQSRAASRPQTSPVRSRSPGARSPSPQSRVHRGDLLADYGGTNEEEVFSDRHGYGGGDDDDAAGDLQFYGGITTGPSASHDRRGSRPQTAKSPGSKSMSRPASPLRSATPNQLSSSLRGSPGQKQPPRRSQSALGRRRGDDDLTQSMPPRFMSPESRRIVERKRVGSFADRLPVKAPRLMVFRNGNSQVSVPIAASSMEQFLERATEKLSLTSHAKIVYDADGIVVPDITALWPDATVYVSTGEAFRDPKAPGLPWTVVDENGKAVTPSRYNESSSFSPKAVQSIIFKVRIFVRNNNGQGDPVSALAPSRGKFDTTAALHALLDDVTHKLHLSQPATRLFDEEGTEIFSTRHLVKDQTIYASTGDSFRDPNSRDPTPWLQKKQRQSEVTRALKIQTRVRAKRNGDNRPVEAIVLVPEQPRNCTKETAQRLKDEFLGQCTDKLSMGRLGTRLFNPDGTEVKSIWELQKEQLVYISQGEPWREPGDLFSWVDAHQAGSNENHVKYYTVHPKVGAHPADKGMRHKRGKRLKVCIGGRPPVKTTRRVRGGDTIVDEALKYAYVVAHATEEGEAKSMYNRENTLQMFFDEATRRHNLPIPARRLFNEQGQELFSFDTLAQDDLVFVTTGEEWRDPRGNVIDEGGKRTYITWGNVDEEGARFTVPTIDEDHRLVSYGAVRVLAYKNGWAGAHSGIVVRGGVGSSEFGRSGSIMCPHYQTVPGERKPFCNECFMAHLLQECADVLGFPSAKNLYDITGKRLLKREDFSMDMTVFVSRGEPFVPPPSNFTPAPSKEKYGERHGALGNRRVNARPASPTKTSHDAFDDEPVHHSRSNASSAPPSPTKATAPSKAAPASPAAAGKSAPPASPAASSKAAPPASPVAASKASPAPAPAAGGQPTRPTTAGGPPGARTSTGPAPTTSTTPATPETGRSSATSKPSAQAGGLTVASSPSAPSKSPATAAPATSASATPAGGKSAPASSSPAPAATASSSKPAATGAPSPAAANREASRDLFGAREENTGKRGEASDRGSPAALRRDEARRDDPRDARDNRDAGKSDARRDDRVGEPRDRRSTAPLDAHHDDHPASSGRAGGRHGSDSDDDHRRPAAATGGRRDAPIDRRAGLRDDSPPAPRGGDRRPGGARDDSPPRGSKAPASSDRRATLHDDSPPAPRGSDHRGDDRRVDDKRDDRRAGLRDDSPPAPRGADRRGGARDDSPPARAKTAAGGDRRPARDESPPPPRGADRRPAGGLRDDSPPRSKAPASGDRRPTRDDSPPRSKTAARGDKRDDRPIGREDKRDDRRPGGLRDDSPPRGSKPAATTDRRSALLDDSPPAPRGTDRRGDRPADDKRDDRRPAAGGLRDDSPPRSKQAAGGDKRDDRPAAGGLRDDSPPRSKTAAAGDRRPARDDSPPHNKPAAGVDKRDDRRPGGLRDDSPPRSKAAATGDRRAALDDSPPRRRDERNPTRDDKRDDRRPGGDDRASAKRAADSPNVGRDDKRNDKPGDKSATDPVPRREPTGAAVAPSAGGRDDRPIGRGDDRPIGRADDRPIGRDDKRDDRRPAAGGLRDDSPPRSKTAATGDKRDDRRPTSLRDDSPPHNKPAAGADKRDDRRPGGLRDDSPPRSKTAATGDKRDDKRDDRRPAAGNLRDDSPPRSKTAATGDRRPARDDSPPHNKPAAAGDKRDDKRDDRPIGRDDRRPAAGGLRDDSPRRDERPVTRTGPDARSPAPAASSTADTRGPRPSADDRPIGRGSPATDDRPLGRSSSTTRANEPLPGDKGRDDRKDDKRDERPVTRTEPDARSPAPAASSGKADDRPIGRDDRRGDDRPIGRGDDRPIGRDDRPVGRGGSDERPVGRGGSDERPIGRGDSSAAAAAAAADRRDGRRDEIRSSPDRRDFDRQSSGLLGNGRDDRR